MCYVHLCIHVCAQYVYVISVCAHSGSLGTRTGTDLPKVGREVLLLLEMLIHTLWHLTHV